jgi:CBS domain-containing protein
MSVMARRRFRHLPVVDADGLCGMVSIGDVVARRLEGAKRKTNVAGEALILSRQGVSGLSAAHSAAKPGFSRYPTASELWRAP